MKAFYQSLWPCSHVFMTLSTRLVLSNASKYICEQCPVLIFFSIINKSSVRWLPSSWTQNQLLFCVSEEILDVEMGDGRRS